MYTEHFGLDKAVFDGGIAQNDDLFLGPRQQRVAANLKIGLTTRDAVVTLTGPLGAGKTTVASEALRITTTRLAQTWIGNTPLAPDEMLEMLLAGFELAPFDMGRVQRIHTWRQFMGEMSVTDTPICILVENALTLGPKGLQALEALTAADPNDCPGANLVLMGTEDLAKLLEDPSLAPLKQRIRSRQKLEAMNAEEVEQYLKHRIAYAGGDYDTIFAPGTAEMVTCFSAGIPRVINNVCETALTVAATRRLTQVSPNIIQRVAESVYGLDPNGEIPDIPVAPAPEPKAAPAVAEEQAPEGPAPSAEPTPVASEEAPVEDPAPVEAPVAEEAPPTEAPSMAEDMPVAVSEPVAAAEQPAAAPAPSAQPATANAPVIETVQPEQPAAADPVPAPAAASVAEEAPSTDAPLMADDMPVPESEPVAAAEQPAPAPVPSAQPATAAAAPLLDAVQPAEAPVTAEAVPAPEAAPVPEAVQPAVQPAPPAEPAAVEPEPARADAPAPAESEDTPLDLQALLEGAELLMEENAPAAPAAAEPQDAPSAVSSTNESAEHAQEPPVLTDALVDDVERAQQASPQGSGSIDPGQIPSDLPVLTDEVDFELPIDRRDAAAVQPPAATLPPEAPALPEAETQPDEDFSEDFAAATHLHEISEEMAEMLFSADPETSATGVFEAAMPIEEDEIASAVERTEVVQQLNEDDGTESETPRPAANTLVF